MKVLKRVLIALCVMSTLGGCGPSIGNVVVHNRGNASAEVEISIGTERFTLPGLRPDEERVIWFAVPTTDTSYDVVASFATGQVVHKRVGYLSNGLTPSDGITLNEYGVSFSVGYLDPDKPPSSLSSGLVR